MEARHRLTGQCPRGTTERVIPPSSVSLDTNWFYVTADVLRKLKFSRYQRSSGASVPVRPVSPKWLFDRPCLFVLVARLVKRHTELPSTPPPLPPDMIITYRNSSATPASSMAAIRRVARELISRKQVWIYRDRMISFDVRERCQAAVCTFLAFRAKPKVTTKP